MNELIQTAYSLEDEVGVALGPVVVNGVVRGASRTGGRPGRGRRRAAGVDLLARRGRAAARRRREFRRPERSCSGPSSTGWRRSCPSPSSTLPYRRHLRARPRPPGRARRCDCWRGSRTLPDRARRMTSARRGRRAQPRRGVLRLRRRRQDHHRSGDRDAGRHAGPARGGGHHRPGPPAGRRARARRADQHAHRGSRGSADRRDGWRGEMWAMMLDTKATFDGLVAALLGRSRRRRSGSWTTPSTGTSPGPCRAPRSTWRRRSSTSWPSRATTTWWWSTRRPPATRSTSSTPRSASPTSSTTGCTGCS